MIKPDIRNNLPVRGKAMLLLIPGFGGGLIAFWVGLPMPFMLGSLFVTAAYCIWRSNTTGRPLFLPSAMRRVSIAVIGTMIGAEFSPEIVAVLPSIWISLAGAAAFAVAAYIVGFQIFRKIGKYGPATALFSAMPGGFIEATTLGERAGADLQLVTVQHFARIVLVVTLIPLLFFAWSGIAVGSAGGQTFSDLPHDLSDYALIGIISVAGIFAGKMLRFPASHMAGPLILSAAAHSLGLAEIQSPDWLLFLAQLIVGTGLGTQILRRRRQAARRRVRAGSSVGRRHARSGRSDGVGRGRRDALSLRSAVSELFTRRRDRNGLDRAQSQHEPYIRVDAPLVQNSVHCAGRRTRRKDIEHQFRRLTSSMQPTGLRGEEGSGPFSTVPPRNSSPKLIENAPRRLP